MAQHYVVIGAGIVGISAALYLQRDGHRVTVIDERGPGEGTSKGNASVLAIDSCIPVATPGVAWDVPGYLRDPMGPLAIRWPYLPKIAPWLLRFIRASKPERVEEISVALRSLLTQALAAHKLLAKEAGEPEILRETGWLAIFETDRKFQSYQWDLELQKRRGVPFQILPSEEIRQFEPSLQPIIKHAVYYPENAYAANNYRLVTLLAADFTRRGGTLIKDQVTGFDFDSNGPTHVVTTRGKHAADNIVVAGGAWSKNLAKQLGHNVPLDTERGYHVTLPKAQRMPRMPLYSGDHSFAIAPLEIGLRLAGTVELGGLEAEPDYRRAEILMKHGRRLFGDLDETGRSNWMGFRPSMPDSLPVVSRGTRWANTFFAFGHGHLGLTLGPISGRLIADLAAGRDPGLDMRPFRVDRF